MNSFLRLIGDHAENFFAFLYSSFLIIESLIICASQTVSLRKTRLTQIEQFFQKLYAI